MIGPGETFPYVPLQSQDEKWITDLCGGRPISDPKLLRNFLGLSGCSFLGRDIVGTFFDDISWKAARALNVEPTKQATLSFNRGLLFYGGVVKEVSGMPQLP